MVEVAGQGGQGLDLVVQEISAMMQVGSYIVLKVLLLYVECDCW
jgi:hypothetical protein